MEFECLALKDLSTPRKTSTLGLEEEEEEDGGHLEQKVKWPMLNEVGCSLCRMAGWRRRACRIRLIRRVWMDVYREIA